MGNDPFGISAGFTEVANEYKTMSKVLIAFCGLAALGILISAYAIYRQTSS